MKKSLLTMALLASMALSVQAASFHVTSPNGGEQLCQGKTVTITWTSTGVTTPVKLILWQNGTRIGDIVAGLPSGSTSYSWMVGKHAGGTAPVGSGYIVRVRVDTPGNTTEYDDSDAGFMIKNCLVIDPRKYILAERLICRIPGPGCPNCPPEFDLGKLREQIGDPAEDLKLVLLKNNSQVLVLGAYGQGRRLPTSVKGKLSQSDVELLKSGKATFSLGLVGADGKMRGTYALQVQ